MESTTQTVEQSQASVTPGGAAKLIREVRKYTRRRFTAEDKIRIVLEGFRKETPVSEICRREKIASAVYYSWLKDFMEAGKSGLRKDTLRGANRDEVEELRDENARLKELAGEQALKITLFKKSLS